MMLYFNTSKLCFFYFARFSFYRATLSQEVAATSDLSHLHVLSVLVRHMQSLCLINYAMQVSVEILLDFIAV